MDIIPLKGEQSSITSRRTMAASLEPYGLSSKLFVEPTEDARRAI
jgi:hypothetical protein